MPWNVDDHRRKLLACPGHYLGSDDQTRNGEVVFRGRYDDRRSSMQSIIDLALCTEELHASHDLRV